MTCTEDDNDKENNGPNYFASKTRLIATGKSRAPPN